MTYVVPKNVVVQMGTVDADTLCGLPCSYYLDWNNMANIPENVGMPDFSAANPGEVLTIDAYGDPRWLPVAGALPIVLRDGVTEFQAALA